MRIPTGNDLALVEGVWAEPGSAPDRLILWVPLGREGKERLWERVAGVPGAEVVEWDGVLSLPATSYRARQPDQGAMGRMIGKLVAGSADQGWSPPGGGDAKRDGGRRTDLALAWTERGEVAEARIRKRWPATESIRRVGGSLFVVAGFGDHPDAEEAEPGSHWDALLQQAESMLADARKANDRRGEAGTLTDVGLILERKDQKTRAVDSLEAALTIYRELNDPARQAEVAGILGHVLIEMGHADRGLPMLDGAWKQHHARGRLVRREIDVGSIGTGLLWGGTFRPRFVLLRAGDRDLPDPERSPA